jgi:hypothetical protein
MTYKRKSKKICRHKKSHHGGLSTPKFITNTKSVGLSNANAIRKQNNVDDAAKKKVELKEKADVAQKQVARNKCCATAKTSCVSACNSCPMSCGSASGGKRRRIKSRSKRRKSHSKSKKRH